MKTVDDPVRMKPSLIGGCARFFEHFNGIRVSLVQVRASPVCFKKRRRDVVSTHTDEALLGPNNMFG